MTTALKKLQTYNSTLDLLMTSEKNLKTYILTVHSTYL